MTLEGGADGSAGGAGGSGSGSSRSGDGSSPSGANPLDSAAARGAVDHSGMLELIAGIPDQIADAWVRTRAFELPASHRGLRAVAMLGMGGSAIGGDLVAGIWSDRLTASLTIVRGYDLPAWVDASTLVVASSNSGNTEETISALGAAVARSCPIVAVTTGGALTEAARRAPFPLLAFPGGGMPRAAVGYSVTLLAGLLERAGLLALTDTEVEGAIAAARAAISAYGPDAPTTANPAKELAWLLLDRLPVVESSGFLAPVARRWKTQFNENSKSTAIWEELPEATHNTVVGYPRPEILADHTYVVFLTSELEHPRNRLRAALSGAALYDAHIGYRNVSITGEGRFGQAISAIVLGDYVTTYLAVLYGIDPTPIEVLSGIKEVLAAADLEVGGTSPKAKP